MSVSNRSTLEAIVLKTRAFGNSDRLVDVLCAKHGLLTLIARGARQSRRRFSGTLELFAQGTFCVQTKPDKPIKPLFAIEGVNLRMGIRRSLPRITRASSLCAMTRVVSPPGQPAAELFAWLGLALDYLDAGDLARSAGFYARCLQHAGLLPDLSSCIRCHKTDMVPRHLVLDGLACHRCASSTQALATDVYQALHGGRIDDLAVADSVERIVLQWLQIQVPSHPMFTNPQKASL